MSGFCFKVVCLPFISSDNEDPVFNPASLPNINKNNESGQKYASVTWTIPTATDNSEATPEVTSSHSPRKYDIGTYSVVYTAKDAADNTATLTFTITIEGECST